MNRHEGSLPSAISIMFLGFIDKGDLQRGLEKATNISVKGHEITSIKRKKETLEDTVIPSRLLRDTNYGS